MKFDWEFINGTYVSRYSTARAKVIGGWIIHHAVKGSDHASESMVFVPDPEHKWEITEN